MQTEEQKRAALKAAIRDARRVLQDKPRKNAKSGFVEDEVILPAGFACFCWHLAVLSSRSRWGIHGPNEVLLHLGHA